MNEYLVSYKMTGGGVTQETVQICRYELEDYSVFSCVAVRLRISEASIVKVKRINDAKSFN